VQYHETQTRQLRIAAARAGAAARLDLSGEMDIACEDAFAAAVEDSLAEATAELVVDLSELSFIDSSGIRMLVELWKRARKCGLDLSIVQGAGQVRRTMEVAGVDRILPILDRGSSRLEAAPGR